MLPLEFSTMILVLIFAALIMYVLVLRRLRPEANTPKQVTKQNLYKPNKNTKKEKTPRKENPTNSHLGTESSCFYNFGYLGTLPKNANIPDECLGCSRIVKCLTQKHARD